MIPIVAKKHANGCRRGGYGYFRHPPNPVGVSRVGDLHQARLNGGNIERGGHPVVQKTPVQHPPLVIELIPLAQRPAMGQVLTPGLERSATASWIEAGAW